MYLSPWDRNHKDYARPEYITYYRNQLRELLSNYGEIFAVWFDGANGGDGYYGGAKETRRIDNSTYYDWPNTWKIVREMMPMAVMFSDAGPDMRWVGNESGKAGDPCWATLDLKKAGRFPGGTSDGNFNGERPGTAWVPAECDVSIRPGWFYHASEDGKVKTPAQLLDIYYNSVGHGSCLNLNLPPDRRGRIHDNDIRSLKEFRSILDQTFAKNLAADAKLTASNTRGGQARQFAPANLVDGKRSTYWATDERNNYRRTHFRAREAGHLQRRRSPRVHPARPANRSLRRRPVEGRGVEGTRQGHQYRQPVAASAEAGHHREGASLRITKAAACPALADFGLYAEPTITGKTGTADGK